MKSQLLAVVLFVTLSPASPRAAQQRHPQLSVNLDQYGWKAPAFYADERVAATDNYVAVTLDAKEPATGPTTTPAEPKSKLSLLIFEADNGKLNAKCGPWPVNGYFDLLPTAGGNFLLHLTLVSDANPHGAETLLLLSPACTQLKQVTLRDQGNAKNRSGHILQSPSRQTLLLIEEEEGGRAYELRGSDTLDLKKQWFEPNSTAPIIIGVSDKGFLGTLPPPSVVSKTSPIADYYRTFEGDWRLLNVSDYFSFLSDDALVGTKDSAPESWKVSAAQVAAVRLDGTPVFSARVARTGYHVERSSEISVSSDGKHVALILDFAGAGLVWGNLDMGPEHHFIYVWSVARPSPCAKIELRNWLDHPYLALSFGPDDLWFAVLVERSRLEIRPLP